MYRSNYPRDPGMPDRLQRNWKRKRPWSTTLLEQLQTNFLGVIVGIAIFSASVVILVWNEGRAVGTRRSLDEGLRNVHMVPNADVVFEENNKKLVHISGRLHTDKELTEPEYGISVQAVKLRRRIQMYQWVEEESRSLGDADANSEEHQIVSYSYYTDWKDDLVKSSLFNNPVAYQNPDVFPVENTLKVAPVVQVGGFTLSKSLVDKINNFRPVTSHERPKNPSIKLHAGMYYHTSDVWNPQVGDIRIEFAFAGMTGEHADEVSVIAQQDGDELHPHTTYSGNTISILYFGIKSPEDIFLQEQARNTLLTWGLRGAGWLLMFIAFSCITNILNVFVSRFSVVRDLVNLGSMSLNASLAMTVSLLLMSAGWIIYHPLLALGVALLSALPFLISAVKLYRRDNAENQIRGA